MKTITIPAEKILPGVTSAYEYGHDDDGDFVKIHLRDDSEIVFRFDSITDVKSFLNRLSWIGFNL